MRAIKKINIIILGLGLLLTACKDDEIVRESSPVANPNSTNVFFSDKNNVAPILSKDSTSFEVIIDREKTSQAQTVNLTVESSYDDSVFQVPSSVSFAAGEASKVVKVPVQMELMKKYHIAIIIDGDQTKPYITQAVYPRIDLNVLKEDYVLFSEGTFTSSMFKASWSQNMQYSPALKAYRLKGLIEVGYDYVFSVAEDGAITQIPKTANESGYMHPSYGMMSVQAQDGSKFDKATDTYIFMLKYTVSAGSFGVKTEKYVVTKKI